MKLVPWVLAAAVVASPALAQTPLPPDPARLALARQIVGLIFSSTNFSKASVGVAEQSLKYVEAQVMFAEADAEPETDTAPRPAEPKFSAGPLHASFVAAIAQLAPKYQDESTTAYARAFTADQLRSILAFFASPAGAAAIAHRTAWSERQTDAEAASPDGNQLHPYVETATEQAFDKSPAGQVLKARQDALGREMAQRMTVLWPPAMAAAEADYCKRQPCGAPEHKVFAGLARLWDPAAQGAAPAGH